MKSTTACMYRGNEILGGNKVKFFFQISYSCHPTFINLRTERRFSVDWFQMSTENCVKLKKTYVGCVTLTLELFPGGQGEGI